MPCFGFTNKYTATNVFYCVKDKKKHVKIFHNYWDFFFYEKQYLILLVMENYPISCRKLKRQSRIKSPDSAKSFFDPRTIATAVNECNLEGCNGLHCSCHPRRSKYTYFSCSQKSVLLGIVLISLNEL